ncbi:phosphatase PAP2 family protein [Vibrio sp. V01_P9A10T6]|uniref:phosphatase PAP2 family protein n=1 Tax=Vibrio sp. V01_P9A10T6 TaxID=2116368 RepID=UPI000D027E6D|nr:phosphatase PAP2 family protein [Vibrio sp. V01_P9A10T6]
MSVKKQIQMKKSGLVLLALFSLLLVPISLVGSSIDLTTPVSEGVGAFFTYLTDSAGWQGFGFTFALLAFLATRTATSRIELLNRIIQIGLLLVIGMAAKTGLKHLTESPRPYTELMTHQLLIPNPAHFYKLSELQKESVMTDIATQVSDWRLRHWQGEKDYSFPSGHTIFATICLAFFGGLFIEQKRYIFAAGLLLWACGVAFSRLWLGMHRPVDLYGSLLFVSMIYLVIPKVYPLDHPKLKPLLTRLHLC